MQSIICFAPLVAHQGGWDEILLVGVPILLIVILLAIAKRRVDAQAARHRDEGDRDPGTESRSTHDS